MARLFDINLACISMCLTGVQVDLVNLMDLKLMQRGGGDSSGDESEKADNDVEMRDASAKEAADVLAQLDLDLDKEDTEEDDEEEDSLTEEHLKGMVTYG